MACCSRPDEYLSGEGTAAMPQCSDAARQQRRGDSLLPGSRTAENKENRKQRRVLTGHDADIETNALRRHRQPKVSQGFKATQNRTTAIERHANSIA